MVYIIFGIQRGERKPGEGGRKLSNFHRLPKRPRPLDVVITIKVAAADRGCRPLKSPENDADGDGAG